MCEFAFLDKDSYEKGMLGIREELDRKMVEFMRTQAPFQRLTYGKVLSLLWEMTKVKYERGQVVYSEGKVAENVYILVKGSFEVVKKLKHEDKRKQAELQVPKGEKKPNVTNVLNEKFPHIKDFPQAQRIAILQRGSMVGQEDAYRNGRCSTSLICHSQKGTLFTYPKNDFMKLRKLDIAWAEILKSIAVRNYWNDSDAINPASKQLVLRHKRAELAKEQGDQQLFNLVFEPRKVSQGKVKPYNEHPRYVKREQFKHRENEEDGQCRLDVSGSASSI